MRRRIGVLVFDEVTLLDVTGPAQVFGDADQMLMDGSVHRADGDPHPVGADDRRAHRSDGYQVVTVGLQEGVVRTAAGVRIAVDESATTAAQRGLDTLIVPGGRGARVSGAELVAAVARLSAGVRRTASVCTGAFLLAQAGLLSGRTVTTHWRYAQVLRRSYPDVLVDADAIFVRSGGLFSSAGVSAGIDLSLALVEDDHGAQVARAVAREMVVFMRRPGGQSQFSVRIDLPAVPDGPLRAVLDAVTADPAGEHTVAALARRAGVSVRHLTRLFDEALGTTPSRFVESSRIEAAQRLLLSGLPVTTVARDSGFGSDETMRRAFGRRLGLTPSAYRDRFLGTAAQG